MDISLVIPVLNEEENLRELTRKVTEVLNTLGKSYEIIYVDDGSRDHSRETIQDLMNTHRQIRLYSFTRNFGQTAALACGFDQAKGDVIVTMDADLQNDPSDIPMMVDALKNGCDLVNGWRKDRKDSIMRRIPSVLANKLIAKVTGVNLKDFGCTLKAYRRKVVQDLRLYGEMHRFIPALASWSGISITEIPVHHHPRRKGKSKYGFSRIIRVILDLTTVKFLVSYSARPMQIFGIAGLGSITLGFVFLVSAIVLKFTSGHVLTNHPFFMLFILLEMIGIQCVFIGLLAELSVRIYHESQKKKTYVTHEKNG